MLLASVFVVLKDERIFRLTDWLDYKDALKWYEQLQPYANGAPVTIHIQQNDAPVVNGFLAQWRDDEPFDSAPRIPSGEVVLRRWSERTYVSNVAAAKAWNRWLGNKYVGVGGGWIYLAGEDGKATGQPIAQGWADLPYIVRPNSAPFYRKEPGGVRYLTERRAVWDVPKA